MPVIIHAGRDLVEDEARPVLAQAQAIVRTHDPGPAPRPRTPPRAIGRRLLGDEISR